MTGKMIALGVMLAMVGVLVAAHPGSQAEEARVPGELNPMPFWLFNSIEFYATSIIPDVDLPDEPEDATFKRGYLLIDPRGEGRVFFFISQVERDGEEADFDGTLFLALKVNGESQEFEFDFDVDDGHAFLIDDLDLNDRDTVEVMQVFVRDDTENTFGVPGLRIND